MPLWHRATQSHFPEHGSEPQCRQLAAGRVVNADFKILKVISGLSGSGKSVALHALEDVGFYCVDNLPIDLLSGFADQVVKRGIDRAAVSIDSRNYRFLDLLNGHLEYFDKLGIRYEFVFLDAEDEVLMQRYGETRRAHPLMSDTVSLIEAIQQEKAILAPLLQLAEKHVDTTHESPHGLRSLIQEDAADGGDAAADEPTVLFKSFAYKHGMPPDADYVFDVRCLPNPYWVSHLRAYNGTQQPIADYLSAKPAAVKMIDQIDKFISAWLPSFRDIGRTYITVAAGCTGGRHRSVYVVEQLAERFSKRAYVVQKRHSELD